MKKANTLLVLAIVLSCQLSYSQSQVKRQFQDETFAETTVVIKDDATTSDMDILNNNFDMDDIGVGQIIRITTENMPKAAPVEEKVEAPVIAVAEEVPAPVAAPEQVIQETQTINIPAQTIQVAGADAPMARRSVSSGGGTRSFKDRTYAKKTKRVKSPKRKHKKMKNNKCYRF